MLPLELIIRALSIVFGLVAFVLAIMVGGFVFVVIGTFLFLVAIIFYIRVVWNQRKNKTGANGKNKTGANDSIIDAEYTVIETKDSDD